MYGTTVYLATLLLVGRACDLLMQAGIPMWIYVPIAVLGGWFGSGLTSNLAYWMEYMAEQVFREYRRDIVR